MQLFYLAGLVLRHIPISRRNRLITLATGNCRISTHVRNWAAGYIQVRGRSNARDFRACTGNARHLHRHRLCITIPRTFSAARRCCYRSILIDGREEDTRTSCPLCQAHSLESGIDRSSPFNKLIHGLNFVAQILGGIHSIYTL